VTEDLAKEELETLVTSIKTTFKGRFELQHDEDLYSCLLLLANQGLLSNENLTLLENFVAPKSSKKEGIKERIESFKSSRQQENEARYELKGRGSDLDDVMAKLRGTKPIVNLYGSGGVGKTTLGKEICVKWPGKHIFVDLREVTEIKDVYFHIMFALDANRTVKKYDQNPVIEQLQKLLEEGVGDVLLLLDNVDQFSGGDGNVAKNMNTNFIDFLHRLLDFKDNKGRAELKVLLISRQRFREGDRNKREKNKLCLHEAIDYKELKVLEKEISAEILQLASGVSAKENKQVDKLVEVCKRKPLILSGVAAILKQKIVDVENLLETIEGELINFQLDDSEIALADDDSKETGSWDYRSEGIDEGQLSCLRKVFFLLPSDTLRHSAVALSLFCRPFSVQAASSVLDADMSETIIILEGLRNSKVLSLDPEVKELMYDIHPLMRNFLRSVGISATFKEVFIKAKRRFCDLYWRKIKDMALTLDKDYMNVFERFDLDKPNIELALDISFKTGYLAISNEHHESIMMCHLFESMLDVNQSRKIFQSLAEAIEEDGREGSLFCAEVRCHQALQVLNLEGWGNAMVVLRLAEEAMKQTRVEFKESDRYRLTRVLCSYVEGEISYRRGNIQRALETLFRSLEIMEELLKDHTIATRCLNAIGNCYNKLGNPEEALKFYTRAFEMRKELSGHRNHVDLPLYKGQIGTVYEGQKRYDKAIEFYQEALELCKELKSSGIVRLALFHRNIANSYAWQKEYGKAYKSAMAGYKIRKDILGNHPHTARSAFQLGLICSSLEEFDEAEDFLAEAWRIEKSLENSNHSEVRDRIVQSYEEILEGDSKREFQKEALEFYQRFWEEEKEFSYANRIVIDEINARLIDSGDRELIMKYETEALRFYERAWNSSDLQEVPHQQREDILQNIFDFSKSLCMEDVLKKYQKVGLEYFEKQLEEETALTIQHKRAILHTLKDLAWKVGDNGKKEKYKKMFEEVEKSADTTIIMLERPLMITASSSGASVEEMEVSSVSKRRSLCSLAQAESKKSKRVEDTVKKGIPSDDELQDLSVRISDWKKLGRKLKFDEAKLTGFARDNDEFSEKALAMLMAWKRRDGSDASYQVLFEALSHSYVSRRDLAEDICCHFN